jgi:hypothetical protein
MKTLNELKSHFQNMSIEEIQKSAYTLYLGGNKLFFATAILLLSDRISEFELNEFIKTLQV